MSGAGTNIQAALKRAVQDISSEKGREGSFSDVLLISDGESELDRQWLKQQFGSEIRLHVALIGQHSPLLKEVATTYRIYSLVHPRKADRLWNVLAPRRKVPDT